MDHRTDITELIPKSLGNYWLIFFGGCAVVWALEFAYRHLPVWSQTLGEKSLAPLDVTSSASVLAWFLSALFLLTAGVALLNSRLGKKFNDPAKGDVWFWTALALILLSLDTQVQFRDTLRVLLVHVSGTPLYQDGAVWWLVVYSFVFGLIAIRLLQDMWAYLPSFFLFFLSILGTVTSQLLKIGALRVALATEDLVILRTALEAFAVLFLFLSFLLFGRRQVFRDPQVAMQWFAKVWKQEFPLKTPQPETSAAPLAQAPKKPEATVEPPLETGPKQFRGPEQQKPEWSAAQ